MKYDALKALVDLSAVVRLQKHVLADLKTAFPFISTIEPYSGQFGQEGVRKTSGGAHAIYLTALAAPGSKPNAAGDRTHDVSLTAYVLAVDVSKIDRSDAAFAIAEKIGELAHFKRWTGWTGRLSYADDIKISRIASEALNSRGACLVAVSWSQSVGVGKDQFANPPGTPDRLVSMEIGGFIINGDDAREGQDNG